MASNRLPGNTVAEKLALNVIRDGECLRWCGAHTRTGYGQISVSGLKRSVHRIAYELNIGPIPVDHEIDHVTSRGCRFRDCINPEHLEAVIHGENLRRSANPRRPGKTHCLYGHRLTPDNVVVIHEKRGDRRRCRTCRKTARRHQQKKRLAEQPELVRLQHREADRRYRARKRAERMKENASA